MTSDARPWRYHFCVTVAGSFLLRIIEDGLTAAIALVAERKSNSIGRWPTHFRY
jgi:hypothetical protein